MRRRRPRTPRLWRRRGDGVINARDAFKLYSASMLALTEVTVGAAVSLYGPFKRARKSIFFHHILTSFRRRQREVHGWADRLLRLDSVFLTSPCHFRQNRKSIWNFAISSNCLFCFCTFCIESGEMDGMCTSTKDL